MNLEDVLVFSKIRYQNCPGEAAENSEKLPIIPHNFLAGSQIGDLSIMRNEDHKTTHTHSVW
jgi:hypothetical protein